MAIKAFDKNLVGFRTVLGDYSRQFMFRLNIPGWYGDSDTLSMLARSATLPAYKIKTSKIGFQGMPLNVATVAEFDPQITVEILADEKQVLRSNIMKWLSYIHDPSTMEASTIGGDTGYKRDNVVFQQLDRTGATIMAYQYYGLFPVSCDAPKPSHDDTEPAKFSVTFQYDFFTYIADAAGKIAQGAGNIVDGSNQKVGVINNTDGKTGAGNSEPQQKANKPPL